MSRLSVVLAVLVVGAVLGSLVIVRQLDDARGPWRQILQERFLFGVPWGTLVVVAFVLGMYLFVQDGLANFDDPVTIPFRAWSYWYPLGMATAPFSHAHANHLLGNLAGTLVLAPIAEYAWGHYPLSRDRRDGTSVTDGSGGTVHTWLADPRVRAVVVFPFVVVAVGLLTSVFAVGPVIGFSGVVFAFAGFAIVRYPITTIVAAIGIQSVLVTVYRAIQSPIVITGIQQPAPAPPSWATIAIQGHALGFLVGIVLGVVLLQRRAVRPDPVHCWIAIVVFGFAQTLWAVYWFGSDGTYVLLRGPGVTIVIVLALLVTIAIAADRSRSVRPTLRSVRSGDRSPLDRALELGCPDEPSNRSPDGGSRSPRPSEASSWPARYGRIRTIAGGLDRNRPSVDTTFTWGKTAFVAVLLVLAVITGPALVFNAFSVDAGDATDATVTVEDYAVTYDEGVENRLVSVAPIEAFGNDSTVEASGVIVWSRERHIWTEVVTAERLEFSGEEVVQLGGPGWRTTVTVERTGWDVVGNDSAYQVWLQPEGEERSLAYASDPVQSHVVIGENMITVVPTDGEFSLEVSNGETSETVDVPSEDASVEVNGITIDREGSRLYAVADGSKAVVATQEEYH